MVIGEPILKPKYTFYKGINMTDRQIIDTVVDCAKLYRDNLEKYNIMFVFKNNKLNSNKEKIEFIETIYYPTNFLHLTGLKSKNYTSANFYYKILNGNLSMKDIQVNDKYTTELKLDVLKNLMNIGKTARSVGIYNGKVKNNLYTEKVVGSVHYCLGYVMDKETKYFYTPNTALKEDIRDITYSTNQVLAILKKKRNDKLYNQISYMCKDFDMNIFFKNEELIQLIDFKSLFSKNLKYQEKIDDILNHQ